MGLTENPGVGGSIPSLPTISPKLAGYVLGDGPGATPSRAARRRPGRESPKCRGSGARSKDVSPSRAPSLAGVLKSEPGGLTLLSM